MPAVIAASRRPEKMGYKHDRLHGELGTPSRKPGGRGRWGDIRLWLIAGVVLALLPLLSSASRTTEEQFAPALGWDNQGLDSLVEKVALTIAPFAEPPAVPSRRSRPVLDPERLDEQLRVYRSSARKTVLELQPFRSEISAEVVGKEGVRGVATLVNLNPEINAWYVLEVRWAGEEMPHAYHLENNDPDGQDIVLDPSYPQGLVIASDTGSSHCDLWSAASPMTLAAAGALPRTFVPLCQEAFALRNETEGHRSSKERVTDFLRDNVWFGEEITVFVRQNFFRDAYLSTSSRGPGLHVAGDSEASGSGEDAPVAAEVTCDDSSRCFRSAEIDIELEDDARGRMAVGGWYPTVGNPGVYVSAMQPSLVATEILQSHRDVVDELDGVEATALAYLIAFDLNRFDVGFALGTDHPRVGWSDRVPEATRDPRLPGPDGIGNVAPLVPTGMVNPAVMRRVAATFTAGFKRRHGAFKWSDLASKNQGSHYGFIENGVVFSKLQPGLATIVIYQDGSLEMKTWSQRDEDRLETIRFARQNGVPIIETDKATDSGVPGPPGGPVGCRELVRLPRQEAPQPASRSLLAGGRGQAVLDLRIFFERYAIGDGPRLSGVQLQLRDAPGHERPRAHLSGPLPDHGRRSRYRASGRGDGSSGRVLPGADRSAVSRLCRQPRLLLLDTA